MRLAVAAVLALVGLMVPAQAETLSPEQISDIMSANVIIGTETEGPFCSGSIVDASRRLILTASHCVAQQYRDEVRDEVDPATGEVTKKTYRVAEDLLVWQNKYLDYEVVSSQRLVAKVLAQDVKTDQALIQIRDTDYKPPRAIQMAPATYAYQITRPCFVIGNSFGVLDASVSTCTISSPQRTLRLGNSDKKLVQIQSSAVGGNSGGAVIDAVTGQYIGTLVAGVPGTNLTFMVPHTITIEFIRANTPK